MVEPFEDSVIRNGRKSRGHWLGAVAGAALVVLAGGCGSPPVAPPVAAAPAGRTAPARYPVTVTDDSGRRVTLPKWPERIVSLAPSHTETLFALGAGDRLVAVDSYSDYPAEAKERPRLNCWPRPPLEQIVALKPDLVVVFTQGDDFLRQMDTVRIPVVKLFPVSYPDTLAGIHRLGSLIGDEAAADRVVEALEARRRNVAKALQGAPRVRVMYELDPGDGSRPYVAGGGGLYGDLLTMSGAENVFGDLKAPSAQVSSEQVVARDPEVILLGDTRSPLRPQTPAMVAARPGWGALKAVLGKRVHPVNSDLLTRPGPRIAEGLELVARLLHPERFR
jgi:iron complex transport system substrate-binding protein